MIWTIVIVVFVVAVVIDIAIGVKVARRYENEIEKCETELWNGWQEEHEIWREMFWVLLCIIAWWAVIPYEERTNFSQWRYPQQKSDNAAGTISSPRKPPQPELNV